MPTFLDRYLQGEYEQVWDDLYAQGEAIYQESLFHDAVAVAQETMLRVRKNIEQITARLYTIGYAFGTYPDGHTKIFGYTQPHHTPKVNIGKEISEFEQLHCVGKLPLSLKLFWQIVGDVDWMGYHPLWPVYSDPLVVYPIDAAKSDYKDWHYAMNEGDAEAGRFEIPIAPDYFHKDNVSGGSPYTILVPNGAIDGVLEYERHKTTFVNYLRICFAHGGFSGVHRHDQDIPKLITKLSDGLLPI
jgi:hypothetical protein